jgi:hypothetical protein
MAVEALLKYPTTYDEDLEILNNKDLTFNHRNCVLFRSGEKEILLFLIKTTERILSLFDLEFKVRT